MAQWKTLHKRSFCNFVAGLKFCNLPNGHINITIIGQIPLVSLKWGKDSPELLSSSQTQLRWGIVRKTQSERLGQHFEESDLSFAHLCNFYLVPKRDFQIIVMRKLSFRCSPYLTELHSRRGAFGSGSMVRRRLPSSCAIFSSSKSVVPCFADKEESQMNFL